MGPCVVCRDIFFFFFQAEDGIRDATVTGVQTCALPISTIPSAPRYVAATGHTLTHGGLSQCMQGRGRNCMVVFGKSPLTSATTFIQLTARTRTACSADTVAMLFSLLHATSQAVHPVQ